MDREHFPSRRALIVTALPVEYGGVRQHLSDVQEEELPHGMVAEVGVFRGPSTSWSVWLIEAGMGNENAALETDRAVAHLRPEVVMFVGIAGGRKDVEIGDVVVASRVYGYESGKDEDSFRPRPDAPEPTYRILQRARAAARQGAWRERLQLADEQRLPEVRIKPVAAGEKVVGSRKSAVAKLLDEHYNDTAAVDMEGHGFHRAMHARAGVEALVVRGVSDLFDNKAVTDSAGGQPLAVRNAAAFALEVLAKFETQNSSSTVPPDPAEQDLWERLRIVAAELYDRGPEQEGIWERAGGELRRIRTNQSASGAWFEAIKLLRQGSGKALSVRSLLRAMQQDFPDSAEIQSLLRLVSD
jgi:nucleoside phosphorylase